MTLYSARLKRANSLVLTISDARSTIRRDSFWFCEFSVNLHVLVDASTHSRLA